MTKVNVVKCRMILGLKTSLLVLIIGTSSLSLAGEWVRNSPTSITFTGQIEKEELANFLAVYKPTDKEIILNSSGGSNQSAIKIAQVMIENKNLAVVVRGMCASSCANYLFLAGHQRKIDRGIVGFHGNWSAFVASPKFKKEALTVAPDIRERVMKIHLDGIREEKEFMAKTGVKQELFDRTQKEKDEGLYNIYLPGPRGFEYYGIKGVQGSQDLSLLNDSPHIKVQYDDGPVATSSSASTKGQK